MYISINPFDQSLLKQYSLDAIPDLEMLSVAQKEWKKFSVKQRGEHLKKVGELLKSRKEIYAKLISLEMGKPLAEAMYEIDKTLTAFDYYIAEAPAFLQAQKVDTAASKSYIAFEPMGVLFSIMPWNFPFWQVFRFAVPSLMAGNTTILKHSPNVPQCAEAIQQLFLDADVPAHLLTNVFLSNEDAAKLIAHPLVAGVSFTGSDATGSIVAGLAGKYIKKSVIELGGNDAFIVLDDADIDMAVAGAMKSRAINSGQSCNGAKRFIVTPKIYEAFSEKLTQAVLALNMGNPFEPSTQIGPLARIDLKEKVEQQIALSVTQGAKAARSKATLPSGGNYVAPTVLTEVKKGICAFEEEIFGPVWSIIRAQDAEDVIFIANDSQYGLGASIWTKDTALAEKMVPQLETGNVFVNTIVKSDARLPFGGIKRSGFGRELSEFGLKEFVNVKTVYIQ